MQLTFRQLQVFEAVARLGSVTRAAEELHPTQPAVSMQIRQLEQSVGLPPSEQVGKRLQQTDAGAVMAYHARLIAEQLRDIEGDGGALPHPSRLVRRASSRAAPVRTGAQLPRLRAGACRGARSADRTARRARNVRSRRPRRADSSAGPGP